MSPIAKVSRVLVGVDVDDASASALKMAGADRLQNTDLIVLSMPADSDTHFGAIVQGLKACVDPVLFVPSTDGIVERSTS